MKNLYRIIFWGIIALLCIGAGVYGIYLRNDSFKKYKDEVKYVVSSFNNSSTTKLYKKNDVTIEASLKGKDLIVTYNGNTKYEYKFKYVNGYYETQVPQSDAFAIVMFKVITDSINKYYGDESENVMDLFDDTNKLLLHSFDEGFSYTSSDGSYTVKIKLGVPIIVR